MAVGTDRDVASLDVQTVNWLFLLLVFNVGFVLGAWWASLPRGEKG